MKIHLIAIGGSAMHNLALALHHKGYQVTGSDDEIFEPSRSRLDQYGLLPAQEGWDESNIHEELDAVIVGMHARQDNPELNKAKAMGLPIYSYPEYLYEQSKDKIRVVIGGSHGKTTITSMILHVMNELQIDVDYMVGAKLEGYDTMVKLTHDAKYIVLEGDEYLASPLDLRPKFHLYAPHIALISGIAWDHINVFPTFDNYINQFEIFTDKIVDQGTLIYSANDNEVVKVAEKSRADIIKIPYQTPSYEIVNHQTVLKTPLGDVTVAVFGEHNLQNMMGALEICKAMGVEESDFYRAIQSFSGASKRLEKIAEKESCVIYKDFAHSPSKLKATTKAVKDQFPDRKLLACMELHTFSSLSKEFLVQYKGSMATADRAIVFFDPHAIAHKKLKDLDAEEVKASFGSDNVEVVTSTQEIQSILKSQNWDHQNLLLMSSGNFGGLNLDQFAQELLE